MAVDLNQQTKRGKIVASEAGWVNCSHVAEAPKVDLSLFLCPPRVGVVANMDVGQPLKLPKEAVSSLVRELQVDRGIPKKDRLWPHRRSWLS